MLSGTSHLHTQSRNEAQLNKRLKNMGRGVKGKEHKGRGEEEFVSDDGHV